MSLNDLPIKRKLVAFVLIITLSVLILSYLILLSYETRTYRETVRHSLATLADITSSFSFRTAMVKGWCGSPKLRVDRLRLIIRSEVRSMGMSSMPDTTTLTNPPSLTALAFAIPA